MNKLSYYTQLSWTHLPTKWLVLITLAKDVKKPNQHFNMTYIFWCNNWLA